MKLLDDVTTQERDVVHDDTIKINHLHSARTTAILSQPL
jgi:hypothetical protein